MNIQDIVELFKAGHAGQAEWEEDRNLDFIAERLQKHIETTVASESYISPDNIKVEFLSPAHKVFETISQAIGNLVFTSDEDYFVALRYLEKLGKRKGAYHPEYRKVLTAQEEAWYQEYGAISPREMM